MYILIVKIKMYAHIISVDILLSKRHRIVLYCNCISSNFQNLHSALFVLCLFVLYRLKAFFSDFNHLAVQVSFVPMSPFVLLLSRYIANW